MTNIATPKCENGGWATLMDERFDQSRVLFGPVRTGSTACFDQLSDRDLSDTRVLFVTYADTRAEICDRWQTHLDGWPAALGILTLRDFAVRSDSGSPPLASKIPSHVTVSVRIETASATNLTEIGVRFSEILDAWTPHDEAIYVCFDALTALSQHVSRSTLLRFTQAVCQRTKQASATMHFHLDPDAVPDETLKALESTIFSHA